MDVTREQVLRFRWRAQHLDREAGGLADTAVLDLGVQDTGPDGALWALALRGVDVAALDPDDLVTAWTLRGAPHVYRREDLASVAAAVVPVSDADAEKRVFDASKPLRAAGIGGLAALDEVAAAMRRVVRHPMVKGEVSTRLRDELPEPYLRYCRPCDAIHLYEQTFRLSALRAGLVLEPGTSPPVLVPVPGLTPAAEHELRHDLVRSVLHLLGPATPKHVATFLDVPLAEVKRQWPDDAVEVTVDGERRSALADDEPALEAAPAPGLGHVRLLGPFDLFLQARDRDLLVREQTQRKELWPVLGRPGAVVVDGEIVGTWRPRQSGRRLRLTVNGWVDGLPDLEEQAERLAAFRGVESSTAVETA